jgi:hypothetical protein
MIRINLLKSLSSRKALPKKKVSLSKLILIAVPLLVVIGVAGYVGWKVIPGKSVEVQKVVPMTPKPVVPVHSRPNIVEDVVREVGDKRNSPQSGIVKIDYADMTFPEKVNYEVQFGKTAFQKLSRAIPSGIGLKNLEIDDFQTIYAVGIGDTKELITTTFTALKNEEMDLLQQPYSYITSNAGKGYRFVVTCKVDFGVDHTDPFQAWDYTGTRDDIDEYLKKIAAVALENSIDLSRKPIQLSAQDIGLYRRYVYHYSGNSEYKQFVAFVLSLHNQKIPCAFKRVQLQAGSNLSVVIEFDLLLTVKE